jgi:hypothetical protein
MLFARFISLFPRPDVDRDRDTPALRRLAHFFPGKEIDSITSDFAAKQFLEKRLPFRRSRRLIPRIPFVLYELALRVCPVTSLMLALVFTEIYLVN